MKHSNHAQHYTPEPMHAEPNPLAVIAGALATVAVLYGITFLSFII
jgi:hypothetical protein